jgi:hypothetical protein
MPNNIDIDLDSVFGELIIGFILSNNISNL